MSTRKLLTLLYLFGPFWLMSTPAFAQPDPCGYISIVSEKLKAVSDTKAFQETFPKVIDTVASWFTEPFTTELEDKEDGLFFTRQPGFTFTVDCESPDSDRRITRSGMFGVGTIVKTISKAQFSTEGVLETYYYARTQNGLNVFVRDEDLRPMEPGYIYFFNRLYEPIDYCIGWTRAGSPRCGGPSRQLNVRHHYAVANLLDSPPNLPDLAGCPQVKALVFNGSKGGAASGFQGTSSLAPEYPGNVSMPSCKNQRFNGLRAYTLQTANQTFFDDNIVAGTYVQLASQRISDAFPFIISRKLCPEKVTVSTKHSLTLGGSMNGKLSALKIFELAADGKYKVEFTSAFERPLEQNTFYLFNNYGIRWNGDTGPQVQDIEIVAACKEGVPDTPLSIVVWSSRSNEPFLISLDIGKLEETAKRVVGASAGAWRSTSTSKIRGRLYGIYGLEQYFLWRDTVAGRIHNELRGLLADVGNDDRSKIIYFYSELVLAFAFSYYSSDETKNIISKNGIEPL